MIGDALVERPRAGFCLATAFLIGTLMTGPSVRAADPEIFSSLESPEPDIPAKIAYVRVVEPDLDKAVDFWTKGVGMKKTTRPNGEAGEVVLQFSEDVTQKSSAIGLILVKGGTSKGRGLFFKPKDVPEVQYQDGKKFAKIVFAVGDIQRIVKRARVRNMEVTHVTDKHAYILEPNRGNMIELIPLSDLPEHPTKFSMQRITYVKLITTDFHQIGDFMGNVLGMSETGMFIHPQRNRELVFGYRVGPPDEPWKHGIINTVYMWDYAETLNHADRDIASRFVIDYVGDYVELTKKLTAMGYPQPTRSIRPNLLTPGGTFVEVSHEYKEDVK